MLVLLKVTLEITNHLKKVSQDFEDKWNQTVI